MFDARKGPDRTKKAHSTMLIGKRNLRVGSNIGSSGSRRFRAFSASPSPATKSCAR